MIGHEHQNNDEEGEMYTNKATMKTDGLGYLEGYIRFCTYYQRCILVISTGYVYQSVHILGTE